MTLREQAAAPLPETRIRVELIASVGRAYQEWKVGRSTGDACEHFEREVVGPVQVFSDQEYRLALGMRADRVGESERQQAAVPARVARNGRRGADQRPDPLPILTRVLVETEGARDV